MGDPETRASDTERDEAARRLRDRWAVGRLTADELDERLSAVYAAKTLGHLERVTRDLPEVTLDAPDRAPTHRMLWPGTAAFHEERRLATPPAQAYAMALSQIVPRMGLQNFHLTDEVEPRRLRFIDHAGLIVTVMFLPAATARSARRSPTCATGTRGRQSSMTSAM